MSMGEKGEVGFGIVRFGDVAWEPRSEDKWPCLVKRQLFDPVRDITIRIVWYPRDAIEPRHVHGGTHAAFVLVGEALVDGKILGPWDVVFGPSNVPHGALHYPVGCLLFASLSGGALHTAVGEDVVAADAGLPPAMIVESQLPWTRLEATASRPACERKVVLADPGRIADVGQQIRDGIGHRHGVVLLGCCSLGAPTNSPW